MEKNIIPIIKIIKISIKTIYWVLSIKLLVKSNLNIFMGKFFWNSSTNNYSPKLSIFILAESSSQFGIELQKKLANSLKIKKI